MTTMWRLTSRSIRRAITKEELWTWQRYRSTAERYRDAMSTSASDSFEWIHLRSQKEINDFVEGLSERE